MVGTKELFARGVRATALAIGAWLATLPLAGAAFAAPGTVTVNVKSPSASSANIASGFRWLLEEDATWPVDPAAADAATTANVLALNMHKSHMTVVGQGHSAGPGSAQVPVPDTNGRYFLSILPDEGADCLHSGCYTQSGRQVTAEIFSAANVSACTQAGAPGACITVTVPAQPTPTAQIFARAFQDSAPINGTWDDAEASLGGWAVFIYDMGGQLNTDTFGNPLGTVYEAAPAADGTPVVKFLGDGSLHTMTEQEVNDPARNPYGLAVGEVLVKNIAPAKYGIQIVPPEGKGWVQTSTIEGTLGLDTWVKANEPRFFAEFGPAGHHAEFGYVNPDAALNDFPRAGQVDYAFGGSHTIAGRVVNMHMARPPDYSFHSGHPLTGCWVGLNNEAGTRGLFTAPCDGDANFSIAGVRAGTYQLVFFDRYLDNIIAFQTVTVADGATQTDPLVDPGANLADVPVFRWFGAHEHWVFNDLNANGIRDANEPGMPDMLINLRYRDGSIYASSTTDTTGYLPFDEIFPFFSWLVAEVDFSRYNATGVTVTTDGGGAVEGELLGGEVPSNDPSRMTNGVTTNFGHGHLSPQRQDCANGGTHPDANGQCQTRTEVTHWEANPDNIVAPPLLEGYNGFLGTTDVFEWGKKAYDVSQHENGGITGVTYYTTTRAENDPRFGTAETWEPGIPRVALALYYADSKGVLYHKDQATGGRGALTNPTAGDVAILADVDNYPLGWQDGGPMGPEDVDNDQPGSTAGVFNLGDAIEAVHTDSFDDNIPTDCPGDPNDPFHQPPGGPGTGTAFNGKCYDGLRNYSQVRPAVFDGGYAFGKPFTETVLGSGYYVVQANAPRGLLADGSYGEVYQIQQEEDKNVDFGDEMKVSPQALPPLCVGGPETTGTPWHVVPDQLTLMPGVDTDTRYVGNRPGCDFRLVTVADGKNTASDFFMFTETPVTGHIQGFVLNDLANEFDPNSPNFGEKMAPSWIPVSVRDYAGNEVYHTYTDKWGTYNAIVPTAYRINTPMPSGVSPNMLQVCLNAPTMQNAAGTWVPEPFHNRQYTQFCYTLDFKPGQTTYLDTPVLPIAAFVGPSNWQLDCNYPSGTPVINFASVGNAGPYIAAGATGTGRQLVVHSLGDANGDLQVLDPLAARVDSTPGGANNAVKTTRNFGFGTTPGTVWIGNVQIPAANVTWGANQLTISVPTTVGAGAAAQTVRTGQLRIRRSNGLETVHGLTITIDQPGTTSVVRSVPSAQYATIQSAVDVATAGDLVMVAPGYYQEMVILTKPIRLQGWGAAAVTINPVQSPTEKIALWREKLNNMANCTHQIGLLPGQANNTASATAPCGFTPGTGLFLNEEGAGILVAPLPGVFARGTGRIDGFTVTGSDQAAGVLVNAYATGLEISNNILVNNQGPFAAGIRVGAPMLLDANDEPIDAENSGLRIHHNHVAENGGLFEAGAGIGLYTGSHRYQVTRNFVCGNYAAGDGAGIAHWGRSNGGVISDNKVLFNQAFDQTVGAGGDGGGIYVAGYAPVAGGTTPGAIGGDTGGNIPVTISRNIIQGNNAGSGNGGGIALEQLNAGNGTNANTTNVVNVVNNMIVDNVAGFRAGGIWMDNAGFVSIINNTIANNDSTATAALAFGGCAAAVPSTRSCPQVAGVYSNAGNIGADFRNNIILGNRSFHWLVTNVGSPAPGANIGTLVPDGLSDLGGTGLYFSNANNGDNNGIRDSLLGDVNNVATGTYYPCTRATQRSNTCVNPTSTTNGEATVFINAYWNRAPAFGTAGTNTPAEGTTLANLQATPAVAAATDEGGNFIDTHYGPLSTVICDTSKGACLGSVFPGTTEVWSDYHLRSTSTGSARDLGANAVAPSSDIDLQARPFPAGGRVDRGADEFGATGLAQLPPVIASIAQQQALASRSAAAPSTFTYQALASDPNGDQLVFRLTAAPAGVAINADSGMISWSPVAIWTSNPFTNPAGCTGNNTTTRNCTVTVQVTDGAFPANNTCPAASCASTSFTLQLRRNVGAPVAVPNTGNAGLVVDTTGIYTLAAPGVLANDSNPNGNQFPLIAQLVTDNTVANGQLTLGSDGSVQFIPNANWVGTTSFTYRVSNDGANWSAPANVTLTRDIAVTSARYINGSWTFTGVGATNLRRIQILRDRGPGGVNQRSITPTQNNQRPQVVGGAWSYTRVGGPSYVAGDTVTINATGANGGAVLFSLPAVTVLTGAALDVHNNVYVQCPGDTNGNAQKDPGETWPARQVCRHLGAGDGFAVMADGTELYTFGFDDLTGVAPHQAIDKGILNAHFPAPTLEFNEGDSVYLTLTNVGMLKRPDLFDPHSVHFHGFPNAGSVFDGVPESSVAINMGFSFTYYYRIVDPGTYMYHCHVEASEHMQMGMLGNLFVHPAQDGTAKTDASNGKSYRKFVYNDTDGSTGFDQEVAIQIGSMDSVFHKEHLAVQPLPFAEMHDDYPMLNGRGYPDTVSADPVPVLAGGDKESSGVHSASESSQPINTVVTATAGQRVLLRISNLNVTQFYTLGLTGGLQMKVVGTGAHILRGPALPGVPGESLYYKTNTVTLGGGEAVDVLVDTTGVAPGTYLLYTTNLNELSNGPQDFGGMMTEIVIQ
jgi:hypothetical protein